MPSKLTVQMRVSGHKAGIRVFAALDVPDELTRGRSSRELRPYTDRAVERFLRKHPGATVTEVRLVRAKESDRAW